MRATEKPAKSSTPDTTTLAAAATAAQPAARRPWSAERAWDWYRQHPWLVGFNYVPSTACNTTEWWQKETFDPATIDREFGWAEKLGFNTTRAFIQYLVWKHDPDGFRQRFAAFLELADKHGLTVMPVLFDDCAFGDPALFDPSLGQQRDPIPGMILPSWTPSPGRKLAADPTERPLLKCYVQDLVRTFGRDRRIIAWDLFNEPMNVAATGRAEWLREIFAWAREAAPQQPLTISVWNDNREINPVLLGESDMTSLHLYANCAAMWQRIADLKKLGRPVICTEWMARLQGSRWDTDLPLFKAEGVACYNWGLVNGRTQCQFAWYHKRGTPEPIIWFHDLFHADGRPYDASEHTAIRQATADKRIDWAASDYGTMRTPRPAATGSTPAQPRMLYGDATRHGQPFAKDPSVIRLGERYLMYYSMAPSTNPASPKGWAVGIAESRDLVQWQKVGEILPKQECEQNGLVNGKALLLGAKMHLFYNTYGNGKGDALCHAVSDDGLTFRRDPSNPILRAVGDWNSGRAIDCDAFEHEGKLWLIYATRDPTMKTQVLAAATAPLTSDFGRAAWTHAGDSPILKPELPWETKCIEAPSVIQRGDTLYLFYGGGYNNDPQQIGCAVSRDGLRWTRLFRQPLWPNGQPGDWNESETGHPGVFEDVDGKTYLFVQGNREKGRTWFLSCAEIGWPNGRPAVLWDSPKFPTKRPGPAAHHADGIDYSTGWTCWRGAGPRGGGLHYANQPGCRADIAFRGTGLTLIHKTGLDCGIAQVLVDGQPATIAALDTYSAEVDWNHHTVVAQGLPPGEHTVSILVTDRRNERSSNAYVQIVGYQQPAESRTP
jgi:predicted GH43/DUF377 family glycosyl hydrolase